MHIKKCSLLFMAIIMNQTLCGMHEVRFCYAADQKEKVMQEHWSKVSDALQALNAQSQLVVFKSEKQVSTGMKSIRFDLLSSSLDFPTHKEEVAQALDEWGSGITTIKSKQSSDEKSCSIQ